MAKRKAPKQLAILDKDLCTGCEACAAVCPVGCIDKLGDPDHPGYVMGICTIDLRRCIGCKQCADICPRNVITMMPTNRVQMIPELAERVS